MTRRKNHPHQCFATMLFDDVVMMVMTIYDDVEQNLIVKVPPMGEFRVNAFLMTL